MRARNLKPSIFKNELLATSDPLYTWIFEGLWCSCDREGRLEDRPRRIHLEINAGRAFEGTDLALNWLAENGFIVRYRHGEGQYIQIVNFLKHQTPHVREAASIIPAPVSNGADTEQAPYKKESGTHPATLNPSSLNPPSPLPLPVPTGTDPADTAKVKTAETPKRRTTPKKPETEYPPDFAIDPELAEYAGQHLPDVDLAALAEKFRLQAEAKQWRYADWRKAFQNFVRNSAPNSGHWAAGQYPRHAHQAGGWQ